MKNATNKVSRRGFLKGSAILAAGAAGASLGLSGCSAGAKPSEDGKRDSGAWDKECDVLVVGTGTSAVAAVAASHYGAESVVVLEKSKEMFGGTTGTSGQGVGIPLTDAAKEAGIEDSEEEVLKYYKSATNGRYDEAVAKSYIKNGNEYLKWTNEVFGFKWDFTSPAFQDYFEPCEGFLPYGRGSLSVVEINGQENSSGMWSVFQQAIQDDEKSELLMGTAATELVVEDGRVVGVAATGSKGEEIRIRANKGVVLGTGGFDHNDSMRKEFLPYPLFVTNAAQGNTGDAQRMGMAIGAAVANMDCSWGLPCFLPSGEDFEELLASNRIVYTFTGNDWAMYRGKPGAVVVNRAGKRFGDEAQAYGVYNLDFGQFSSKDSNYPNIPAYFICDSSYTAMYALPGQEAAGDPIPDFFVQADTIGELAEKLGIDAEGLAAELDEFNANAAEGKDPKFGRGEKSIDVNSSGLYAGSRTDIPNPCLSPVETGPFYGAVYVPGTCGTCGGLKIDENSQVVNFAGEPIEGLYAVGNCSSGVSGGKYLHGGMTVGSGSVMSWVAVRHMLGVS
ncbi:FAD-binding protein [Raoultibacter timonensis]|uniref:FAD-binding protein n=1 Tax=Raoultibacter timonensis TaxID=1907662 RepID=UPI000C83AF4E|nr:FAD-binding protein [Raoultibacter timonensis]